MGGRCNQLVSKPASDALLLRAIVVAENLFPLPFFKTDVPEVGDEDEAEGDEERAGKPFLYVRLLCFVRARSAPVLLLPKFF